MKRTPSANWPHLEPAARPASGLARIGRILLLLTAISALTMPVTERIWTWDHFAQGGRDFELSTILVLSFFCLVLVLSRQGRQCLASIFARWRHVAWVASQGHMGGSLFVAGTVIANQDRMPRPNLSMQTVPLQI